jgi:hypothetical protein
MAIAHPGTVVTHSPGLRDGDPCSVSLPRNGLSSTTSSRFWGPLWLCQRCCGLTASPAADRALPAGLRGSNVQGKITVERVGRDVIRLTMVADVRIAGASGELAGRTSGAADARSLDAVGGGEPGAGGRQLFSVDQVAEILGISWCTTCCAEGSSAVSRSGACGGSPGSGLTNSSTRRRPPVCSQAAAIACRRIPCPVSAG